MKFFFWIFNRAQVAFDFLIFIIYAIPIQFSGLGNAIRFGHESIPNFRYEEIKELDLPRFMAVLIVL
jgi:hypothetical protein